jgi:hypothetical protein
LGVFLKKNNVTIQFLHDLAVLKVKNDNLSAFFTAKIFLKSLHTYVPGADAMTFKRFSTKGGEFWRMGPRVVFSPRSKSLVTRATLVDNSEGKTADRFNC